MNSKDRSSVYTCPQTNSKQFAINTNNSTRSGSASSWGYFWYLILASNGQTEDKLPVLAHHPEASPATQLHSSIRSAAKHQQSRGPTYCQGWRFTAPPKNSSTRRHV